MLTIGLKAISQDGNVMRWSLIISMPRLTSFGCDLLTNNPLELLLAHYYYDY
jgi:hypothetical protein